MRVLIVSDAWLPQVNGVVTSLQYLIGELRELGHEVRLLSPGDFRSRPCPTYPEIPLVWDLWRVGPAIRAFRPDCAHLATEGPLGWAARRWLLKHGMAFSTAIHTRFPEYVHTRWPWLPLSWGYALLRAFHRPSRAVLVSTARLRDEFSHWRLSRLVIWRKGVDTRLFSPQPERNVAAERPVFLYVGRIAPEKNLEAFLALDLPGEKRVVGDGPQRAELEARYPEARFLGYRHGRELAAAYAEASVLVFPSRTDTYGLVMLEALACGTPVAAFPVPGPLDVVEADVSGVLDEDLGRACLAALVLDRERCAELAGRQSWRASALEFLAHQVLLDGEPYPLAQVCTGFQQADALAD
ncbi:glycosyltransferase family 4 protein [Azotobacter vinelandii]|uniref:glycosyltransferase family 4 protein n=1 Tax=Azotobacter vinelandii TaxID=354 RepID=UPI00077468A6|nr:glycosyltransferase family 1 protein [Azotobacter vinelandii]WKN20335.1 glycosyltransferase family 1 protein [Azotobacter vinelandii]SFX87972.1 Glycosyltransferase involved in cell wall bisynthesis [Azotobacter vinelandii]